MDSSTFLSLNNYHNIKLHLLHFTVEYQLKSGVDVIVGTPGRILDFAQKGTLDLSKLKHMVLDEVDRMLDMGFAENVDDILQFAYTAGKYCILLMQHISMDDL